MLLFWTISALCIFFDIKFADAVHSEVSTNYASAFLGAKVVEDSPESSGSRFVLREDSSYFITPCDVQRKRFTIQLAREVSVRLVTITSLEYFSSIVKLFTLLGSNEFPCVPPACMWYVLGRFRANFTRATQEFVVGSAEHPSPTIRFLRLLWISHHGREKSCTLTTLQVFGHDRFELAASMRGLSDDQEELTSEPFFLASSTAPLAFLGPLLPSAAWRDNPSLNTSSCPATTQARDVEIFLEFRRLDIEETCTWNVTRLALPPDIISSRQLAWLKSNISAIRAALSLAASAEELSRVRDNVTQFYHILTIQTDSFATMANELRSLERRLMQLFALIAALLGIGLLLGLGCVASRTKLQTSDSFVFNKLGRSTNSSPYAALGDSADSLDVDVNKLMNLDIPQ